MVRKTSATIPERNVYTLKARGEKQCGSTTFPQGGTPGLFFRNETFVATGGLQRAADQFARRGDGGKLFELRFDGSEGGCPTSLSTTNKTEEEEKRRDGSSRPSAVAQANSTVFSVTAEATEPLPLKQPVVQKVHF